MTDWKPKRQHRRNVYYKVQVFDSVSLTWRDESSAFDEVSAANEHITQALSGRQTRIMVVDGSRRYLLKS